MRSLAMGLPPGLEFRTRDSWPSASARTRSRTGSGSISSAATRSTGTAPNCAPSSEPAARASAARPAELPPHPARRQEVNLRGRRQPGAGPQASRGPFRREGLEGGRWYAWSWLATASPEHCLLIRRHLKSGELAFHYCFVPEGQPLTLTRLIRAAGLRWPVEEGFRAARTPSGSMSPRSGSIPRSPATPCWSWPPWPSVPSPPPCSKTAPMPSHHRQSAQASRPRPTPAYPAYRPGNRSPARRLAHPARPARPHRLCSGGGAPARAVVSQRRSGKGGRERRD